MDKSSRWTEALRAVLQAVSDGEESGRLLSSEALKDVFEWRDETDRLHTIDDFYSSGYLLGTPYWGSHPHFHELRDLRLGARGKNTT